MAPQYAGLPGRARRWWRREAGSTRLLRRPTGLDGGCPQAPFDLVVSTGDSRSVSDLLAGGETQDMAGSPSFVTLVGDALRTVRYTRGLSQRDLAAELEVGKSTVARLEDGVISGPVLLVLQVLERVGFEVTVVDRRSGAELDVVDPPFPRDPQAAAIVAFWRQRVQEEGVRDAAGRRPPAHRHVYPLKVPHPWWTARHPRTPWVFRPVWSWTRHITWTHVVRRFGRYPAYVGHPPCGGAPMQGRPP